VYEYVIPEKRKYKRIKKPYLVRFRIKPYGNQGVVSKDWNMVAVNDLGAGGLFFNSSRKMKTGTTLDLKIDFSRSIPPIECRGVITRLKSHPNTSIFGIASAFTGIDEHIKEMINKTAEEIAK
jgi:hypothetical protein